MRRFIVTATMCLNLLVWGYLLFKVWSFNGMDPFALTCLLVMFSVSVIGLGFRSIESES